MDKAGWIGQFRAFADVQLPIVKRAKKTERDRASEVNKRIKSFYSEKTVEVKGQAIKEKWSDQVLLEEMLTLTYASYVTMLEYRNAVWPYEYMAFARRIGELWEPFCKLPFEYPVKSLQLIDPPVFSDVQARIERSAIDFIRSLSISPEDKQELIRHYSIPWTLVDSGGIRLALDLHFEQGGVHYNCDLKSGFSSNEKGNTNRLLLVASIYHSLGDSEKTLLFVRQNEDENNHYLQTLKNSPYWDVYCAKECYEAMAGFTGYNLRTWLDENATWRDDISSEFRAHLEANDLLKYLAW